MDEGGSSIAPSRSVENSSAPARLVEGEDYYLENGLMVFTAHYLSRRGYCCNRGCRHCPYYKSLRNEIEEATRPKPHF